jgi:hypothetical protein
LAGELTNWSVKNRGNNAVPSENSIPGGLRGRLDRRSGLLGRLAFEFGFPATEGQLAAVYTGEIFDLSAIGRAFDRQKNGYCTALVA